MSQSKSIRDLFKSAFPAVVACMLALCMCIGSALPAFARLDEGQGSYRPAGNSGNGVDLGVGATYQMGDILASFILSSRGQGSSAEVIVSLDDLSRYPTGEDNTYGDMALSASESDGPQAAGLEASNAIRQLYGQHYIETTANSENEAARTEGFSSMSQKFTQTGLGIYETIKGLFDALAGMVTTISPVGILGFATGVETTSEGFAGTLSSYFAEAGLDADGLMPVIRAAGMFAIGIFAVLLIVSIYDSGKARRFNLKRSSGWGARALTIMIAIPLAVALNVVVNDIGTDVINAVDKNNTDSINGIFVDSLEYAVAENYDMSLIRNSNADESSIIRLNTLLSIRSVNTDIDKEEMSRARAALDGYLRNDTFTVGDYISNIQGAKRGSMPALSTSHFPSSVYATKQIDVDDEENNFFSSGHTTNPRATTIFIEKNSGTQGYYAAEHSPVDDEFLLLNTKTPVIGSNAKISEPGINAVYKVATFGGTLNIAAVSGMYTDISVVRANDPRTYIYGATPGAATSLQAGKVASFILTASPSEESQLVDVYTGEPIASLTEAEDSGDIGGDSDESTTSSGEKSAASMEEYLEALYANQIRRAAWNKYAGMVDGNTFSTQSTAFLLQSLYANDTLTFMGENTPSSSPGASVYRGKTGVKAYRYVIPRTSQAQYEQKVSKLGIRWMSAAIAAAIGFFWFLTTPLVGSIIKIFSSFFRAVFTGDIFSLAEHAIYTLALYFSVAAWHLGTLAGALVTGLISGITNPINDTFQGASDAARDALSGVPVIGGGLADGVGDFVVSIGVVIISVIMAIAMCWPIKGIKTDTGQAKEVGVIGLLVTAPYVIASSLCSNFDMYRARLYGTRGSNSGFSSVNAASRAGGAVGSLAKGAAVMGAAGLGLGVAGLAKGAKTGVDALHAADEAERNLYAMAEREGIEVSNEDVQAARRAAMAEKARGSVAGIGATIKSTMSDAMEVAGKAGNTRGAADFAKVAMGVGSASAAALMANQAIDDNKASFRDEASNQAVDAAAKRNQTPGYDGAKDASENSRMGDAEKSKPMSFADYEDAINELGLAGEETQAVLSVSKERDGYEAAGPIDPELAEAENTLPDNPQEIESSDVDGEYGDEGEYFDGEPVWVEGVGQQTIETQEGSVEVQLAAEEVRAASGEFADAAAGADADAERNFDEGGSSEFGGEGAEPASVNVTAEASVLSQGERLDVDKDKSLMDSGYGVGGEKEDDAELANLGGTAAVMAAGSVLASKDSYTNAQAKAVRRETSRANAIKMAPPTQEELDKVETYEMAISATLDETTKRAEKDFDTFLESHEGWDAARKAKERAKYEYDPQAYLRELRTNTETVMRARNPRMQAASEQVAKKKQAEELEKKKGTLIAQAAMAGANAERGPKRSRAERQLDKAQLEANRAKAKVVSGRRNLERAQAEAEGARGQVSESGGIFSEGARLGRAESALGRAEQNMAKLTDRQRASEERKARMYNRLVFGGRAEENLTEQERRTRESFHQAMPSSRTAQTRPEGASNQGQGERGGSRSGNALRAISDGLDRAADALDGGRGGSQAPQQSPSDVITVQGADGVPIRAVARTFDNGYVEYYTEDGRRLSMTPQDGGMAS